MTAIDCPDTPPRILHNCGSYHPVSRCTTFRSYPTNRGGDLMQQKSLRICTVQQEKRPTRAVPRLSQSVYSRCADWLSARRPSMHGKSELFHVDEGRSDGVWRE